MNVGVGGSICIITPARYSGVCRKPIRMPRAAATTAVAATR
jgi:hypothetical protein